MQRRLKPSPATRLLAALRPMPDLPAERPPLGPAGRFQDPRLAGLRRFSVRGFADHLVFYRAYEGTIEVVRVLHGARDIEGLMGGED